MKISELQNFCQLAARVEFRVRAGVTVIRVRVNELALFR